MKKLLTKFINLKGLPIQLVGTSLLEVLLLALTIIGLVSVSSFLWSGSITLLIWLFILTIWAFIHVKKSSLIQERFEEIDQRDLDFKDECDRHFAKLDNLTKQVNLPHHSKGE